MNIVFMGTPDIAAESLLALIKAGHNILAVFTKPDKPVGRKQILTPPPVKVLAVENNIPVFQPETLKNGEAYKILAELNPEIIVVVAYGKLLPKEILELPRLGCINAHASILPKYRGSSPIQWCIVSGESETGITIMHLNEGMDTGDVIEIAKISIGPDETAEELYERLSLLAGQTLIATLEKIQNGTAVRTPQNDSEASYAPIIKREMGLIDFNKSASDIHNLVRGFYSWPAAFCFLGDKRLKVLKTEIVDISHNAAPGTVIKSDDMLCVACGIGAVRLKNLQIEGSKRVDDGDFLRGNKIAVGTVLGSSL